MRIVGRSWCQAVLIRTENNRYLYVKTEQHYGAHSAEVDMRLVLDGGTSIGITHMGPDFLFIEPAGDHAPGFATIFLRVDASQRQWRVRLPNGIFRSSRRVELALTDQS